ncbi:hypothetical protein B484DRAFT_332450 [Ochromonadaceae sp. CCMP2298]|nr:hypothetical protein B484DRAFT_332450 [Ochromonadaceae sp. CCMP2298]|mmetsp:Transcript_6879/g.15093  ORF Transcript_6879/g.15093 Transcript_6879/m.15093 type:complete len:592 (-) Transcript_6879:137-1912(-)|eukprot:CAMPEP_0173199256 /NCGR_PEP_ID=MMETSP1141-20130122/17137_1 /TAXON_ID=483371 /ORGANISM="non described non described, Strain CCMP2298" /LENGTH=591 /DNA_ID=CAMNT_0014124131 /DNA_START=17 /DNA_END=1792 /DNA_ORIENTATION=+
MSKVLQKDEVALNQQVEELRERMRILQNDRKSNIDVLEANKNSNRDDIKRMRTENKDLRQKLAQLQKTTTSDDSNEEQRHLEKEVEKLRKINDDMNNRSTRLCKELDGMRDSMKDLELDSQRPHMEDNEFTRRIRALENKLDKAMIKYNEAQSIRKTYEQIVRRLTEERVGFDNQLAAIERTLSSKQKDYEELMLLSGDANHARETALGELERVRAGYEEERKRREKELRERHQMVQLRRQMLERMKYRERMRHQLSSGSGGKPDSPQQRELSSLTQKAIQLEKIESRNKVDIFENAFRKIKEATGVSDVNEVIQKIVSQESTTENLIGVTRENQGKIEALSQLRKQIKAHCEEIKYSGVGGGQHRKMVDSFEDQLANSATRLERSRLKYERLSKVLISMKAGVGHLQDKMESFREEIKGSSYSLTDETITEVLRECEVCFVQLSKRVRAGEDEAKRARIAKTDVEHDSPHAGKPDSPFDARRNLQRLKMMGSTANMMAAELDDTAGRMSTLRPYNQRIDLAHTNEYAGDALDESLGDLEDDELTRDKVKRASSQILSAMDKRKRKPRGKKAPGGGGGEAADDGSVGSRPN